MRHIKRWNKWRKNNSNSKLHKFLVLIGLVKSPTMEWTFLEDEMKKINNGLLESVHDLTADNTISNRMESTFLEATNFTCDRLVINSNRKENPDEPKGKT